MFGVNSATYVSFEKLIARFCSSAIACSCSVIFYLQVAEMHGELMEFNEHLQRQLLQKENVVKQLSSELVELRGPVCHIIT